MVAEISPTAPAKPDDSKRRRRYARMQRWEQARYVLLVAPLIIYLAVFYIYPVAAMLVRSLYISGAFSLVEFERLFETPVYWRVFVYTVRLALVTTLVCLLLGYPLAYVMSRASPGRALVLFALVLLPFWTSILVRSYAWMVLLGRGGIINDWLMRLGLIDQPLTMLYTTFAVYLAMVYILLPFMVLPLYSSLRNIDQNLFKAAEGLGASPARIFLHVVLPLSKPGIAAGTLLVFIIALGFYITPVLMGGRRDVTIAVLIAQNIDMYDWNFAAALAALLLVFSLVVFYVFDRAIGIDKIFRR